MTAGGTASETGTHAGAAPSVSIPVALAPPFLATDEDLPGSAPSDPAVARALDLHRRGDTERARDCLIRAEERGSAEAAYVRGFLAVQADDRDAARDALRRADALRSLWAPLLLAALAEQDGDPAAAERAVSTALERAEAADAAGSADGAYVVAAIAGQRGDLPRCIAAARRADERGAALGSLLVTQLAAVQGDPEEAAAAAARAEDRGLPSARLVLGDGLQLRRRTHLARRAWRAAATAAAERDDEAIWQAAVARLHPGSRAFLRQYRTMLLLMGLVGLGFLAVGQWRWLPALAAWALVPVFARLRPEPGTLIRTGDDDVRLEHLAGLSVGGLRLAGGVVDEKTMSVEGPEPDRREATARDRLFGTVLVVLVAALACAATVWAAGLIDGSAMLRLLFLAAGAAGLWQVAWRAPDRLRPAEPGEEAAGDAAGLGLYVQVPTSPFTNWHVFAAVGDPRVYGIVEAFRERWVDDGPLTGLLRRARTVLQVAGTVLFAVFFAAKALPATQEGVATGFGVLASAVIGMAVLGIGSLLAVERAFRSLVQGAWASLVTSIGYLLVVAALVVVAYRLGFLESWVGLLESLGVPR